MTQKMQSKKPQLIASCLFMFSISNHQFLSQSFWVAREHEWPRSRMRLHRDVPPSSLRINFEKVMFLALKIHTIYWERETWSSISLCRAKFNLRLQRLYISGSFHKISKPINICCRYSKWWWWWWWWWWLMMMMMMMMMMLTTTLFAFKA